MHFSCALLTFCYLFFCSSSLFCVGSCFSTFFSFTLAGRQLVETALRLNDIGVAHNDITPDNIMLEKEVTADVVSYRVTLVDFGTATILDVSR